MPDTVRAVLSPAGDPAWSVTGYHNVRRLLGDRRLGRTHPEPERAPRYSHSVIFGRAQPASPSEAADHDRFRDLVASIFSPRRTVLLRPRVQRLVDEALDELDGRTPPVDFHEAVSFPLPALVICELLGVPIRDRGDFRRWCDEAADMDDEVQSLSGLGALWRYMEALVESKRRTPSDDVLSDLVVRLDDGSDTAVAEVARLGAALLFAGHETTVAAIDKGVLLLAGNDLASTLRDRPDLVDAFVEEVLRLPLPVPQIADAGATGLPRWANAPIELNGLRISPGELVLLDLQGANLDAAVFERPDTLDLARTANPHLAFGHGPHFCLGAPLARLELRTLFDSLVRRFPALHLMVPIEDLRPRSRLLTGGLQDLPVAW